MEDTTKEFIAYSRKLLRSLNQIRKLLDCELQDLKEDEFEEIKKYLDELIADTKSDIEA